MACSYVHFFIEIFYKHIRVNKKHISICILNKRVRKHTVYSSIDIEWEISCLPRNAYIFVLIKINQSNFAKEVKRVEFIKQC